MIDKFIASGQHISNYRSNRSKQGQRNKSYNQDRQHTFQYTSRTQQIDNGKKYPGYYVDYSIDWIVFLC